MCEISVLIPAKNAEKYISECLDSVFYQTFPDFEVLIFDDNSSDHTLDIVKSYQDPRLRFFSSKAGFIANLNSGIEIAKGKYIARMDADDIMHPQRLEIQLNIMQTLAIDLCASWIKIFGDSLEAYVHEGLSGILEKPLIQLIYRNFIPHPTVMLRKEFLKRHHLKYENYLHTEDYKLWSEIAKRGGVFYIVPQPLVSYRMSESQVTIINEGEVQKRTSIVSQEITDYLQQRLKDGYAF